MTKGLKVALVQGGLGAEREISHITGGAFAKALTELGYFFEVIEADEKLPVSLVESKAEVALLALHGKYAEDGTVQSICEYLKIPYTGSGVLSSALCMDKIMNKELLKAVGIPTPNFLPLGLEPDSLQSPSPTFPLPWILKPSREGSSFGIHIIKEKESFQGCLSEALQYDRQLVLEEFVEGVEVTVPVWLGRPMTVIEIEPKVGFFDYKNKYTKGHTEYYLPARLPSPLLSLCQELALRVYKACRVRTYGRVDFIISKNHKPYVLEVNTLPGFTPTSLLPMSAAYEGISFIELVQTLVERAGLDYAIAER